MVPNHHVRFGCHALQLLAIASVLNSSSQAMAAQEQAALGQDGVPRTGSIESTSVPGGATPAAPAAPPGGSPSPESAPPGAAAFLGTANID